MGTSENRAAIKFFILEDLSANKNSYKNGEHVKKSASSFPTELLLTLEFKRGRISVEDE